MKRVPLKSLKQNYVLSEANDDSEEEFESEVGSSASVDVPSLLDKLKSPTVSNLARKRIIKTNPPKGHKRCKGAVISEPHSISPSSRIREYPNEFFRSISGKLNFSAMLVGNISLKKSIIVRHNKLSKAYHRKEAYRSK